MAEAYLKNLVLDSTVSINVSSAGLNATFRPPADEAIEILLRDGIDVSKYVSRQLTYDLLESSDLVLTMERRHRDAILINYPKLNKKVLSFKEFAGANGQPDVEDPYGKGLERFEACAEEIKTIISQSLTKIMSFMDGTP